MYHGSNGGGIAPLRDCLSFSGRLFDSFQFVSLSYHPWEKLANIKIGDHYEASLVNNLNSESEILKYWCMRTNIHMTGVCECDAICSITYFVLCLVTIKIRKNVDKWKSEVYSKLFGMYICANKSKRAANSKRFDVYIMWLQALSSLVMPADSKTVIAGCWDNSM